LESRDKPPRSALIQMPENNRARQTVLIDRRMASGEIFVP
jgi:hypothetical protein